MSNPLLYVVAINYNSAVHTIEMVQSIFESDYKNIKIVIVDNASDISEYEKLESLKEKAVVIRCDNNLGFSGGNNVGIRYAIENMADYIMILNNDTTVEPDAISIMMNEIMKEDVDVISPKILYYHDHSKVNYAGGSQAPFKGGICIWGLGKKDQGQYDQKQEITFVHGCCTLASAQDWKDVNLMDERYFLYYEDVALSNSFQSAGKNMWYCPEAVIYHKESASTKKYSANYQYYLCRNRLIYIKEYIKFPVKIVAYGYTFLFILKNLKRKNFELNNIKDAVHDYIHGKYGCRNKSN